MFILKRYYKFYKSNGLSKTILKIILTPLRLINKKIYNIKKKNIFKQNSAKKKFELIYKNNFWSSKESVSGLGSEYKNTINIRKEIIILIKKYNIKSILDAPCGDFNWIKSILNKNLKYIGGDIVKNLIDKNNNNYKNENINFIPLDITTDKLPKADLMICRDCLIHLSFKNINLFFKNFINSDIKFLLLTSYKLKDYKQKITNLDITDGEFREIDLSEHPFSLTKPIFEILDKDEQSKTSGYNCYLNMYTKKQIQDLFIEKKLKKYFFMFLYKIYSISTSNTRQMNNNWIKIKIRNFIIFRIFKIFFWHAVP